VKRRLWWAAVSLYILITYALLGVMPAIWDRINNLFGGRGVIVQYLFYAAAGAGVFAYIVFIKKERSLLKYFLFSSFVGFFFIFVFLEKNPGEKIHMAQYGILGVLSYNALKIDFDRFDKRLYIYGSLLCFIAGAVDEVIQGILPNRYFTLHDIFVNGASGIIALLAIRFNILKKGNLAKI
jgi:VanZ family protein